MGIVLVVPLNAFTDITLHVTVKSRIGFIVLHVDLTYSLYVLQLMRNIGIPIPKFGKLRLFELFPVILAIAVTWIYAIIVTEGASPFKNFHLTKCCMHACKA